LPEERLVHAPVNHRLDVLTLQHLVLGVLIDVTPATEIIDAKDELMMGGLLG
jgi:hypothetical protein